MIGGRRMGNVLTYLKWRGDLDFSEQPFNEADNMVLSLLSYIPFRGIVPGKSSPSEITVRNAARAYFVNRKMSSIKKDKDEYLFYLMAQSKRYMNATLSDYVNLDTTDMQFTALTIGLPDGTCFISYKGNEDSILDWRKSFISSYELSRPMEEALSYMETVMGSCTEKFRVGGLLKGGLYALYASMKCNVIYKDRLINIYSNDGNGLAPDLDDVYQFEAIKNRFIHIVPQFSIMGLFYEPDVEPIIVDSDNEGLLQFDPYSWNIEGVSFVQKRELSPECQKYNKIFDIWVESASKRDRDIFIKNLFDAFDHTGVEAMSGLTGNGYDSFGTILVSLAFNESRTKIVAGHAFDNIKEAFKRMHISQALVSQYGVTGVAFALFGMILLMMPKVSYHAIGIGFSIVGVVWSGYNLYKTALSTDTPTERRPRIILYMMVMCFMVLLGTQITTLTIMENLIVGLFFFASAIMVLRNILQIKELNFAKVFGVICVILFVLVGILSMTTLRQVFTAKAMISGILLILLGVLLIVIEMLKQGSEDPDDSQAELYIE